MPELPEVETTRRGIAPHILNKRVTGVMVRERKLRWPIPSALESNLRGQVIRDVGRRAKYLLLATDRGTLMIHLGMSGSLRIVGRDAPLQKHDHVDISFGGGKTLRYRDPRKFGSMLWLEGAPALHPLLRDLGPEPLSDDFDGDLLFSNSRKRKSAVKPFIMDSHQVVGVGNIYANEALFRAGIRPGRQAGTVTRAHYRVLAGAIKDILSQAIEVGGTTLRDFLGGDGEPGYFKQSLAVYGRGGLPCLACGGLLKEIRLGQRSTVYCSRCQR